MPRPDTPRPAAPRLDALSIAMGLGFALIWSSAFTAAKVALADAPPFLLLTARFALSGALAVGLAAALGQRLPTERRIWGLIVLFGLCQNALYLGLNFLAMTRVPAGLAAIIASALPLIVAAFGRAFFGERLSALGLAGLAAGFAGVVAIMGGRIAGGADALGALFCVIGAVALALATRAARALSAGGSLLMTVGLQMLVGAAALAPIGFGFESVSDVRLTPSLLIALSYSVLVAGIAATLLWFALVARVGPTAASAYHFLNPPFGVAVAALLLGEPVGWLDAAGVAVISAGIAAVQLAKRPARAA